MRKFTGTTENAPTVLVGGFVFITMLINKRYRKIIAEIDKVYYDEDGRYFIDARTETESVSAEWCKSKDNFMWYSNKV